MTWLLLQCAVLVTLVSTYSYVERSRPGRKSYSDLYGGKDNHDSGSRLYDDSYKKQDYGYSKGRSSYGGDSYRDRDYIEDDYSSDAKYGQHRSMGGGYGFRPPFPVPIPVPLIFGAPFAPGIGVPFGGPALAGAPLGGVGAPLGGGVPAVAAPVGGAVGAPIAAATPAVAASVGPVATPAIAGSTGGVVAGSTQAQTVAKDSVCYNIIDTTYPSFSTYCSVLPQTTYALPNWFNHQEKYEVNQQLALFQPALDAPCFKHLRMFICPLLFPPCKDQAILPCASFCRAIQSRCSGYDLASINCDSLPSKSEFCPTLANTGRSFPPTSEAYDYTASVQQSPLYSSQRSYEPQSTYNSGGSSYGATPVNNFATGNNYGEQSSYGSNSASNYVAPSQNIPSYNYRSQSTFTNLVSPPLVNSYSGGGGDSSYSSLSQNVLPSFSSSSNNGAQSSYNSGGSSYGSTSATNYPAANNYVAPSSYDSNSRSGLSRSSAQFVPSYSGSNDYAAPSVSLTVTKTNDYGSDLSFSASAQNMPSFANTKNNAQQSSSYNAGGSYGSYSAPAQNVPSFANSDNSGQQSSSYNAGSSYGSPSVNPSGSYGSYSAPAQNMPSFANSDNSGQQSSSYNAGGSSYGSPSVNPSGSYGSYSAPAQNMPSFANSDNSGQQSSPPYVNNYVAPSSYGSNSRSGLSTSSAQFVPSYSSSNDYAAPSVSLTVAKANDYGSDLSFSASAQNMPSFANTKNNAQQSSSYNAGSSYGSPSVNPSANNYVAPSSYDSNSRSGLSRSSAQFVPSYSGSNDYAAPSVSLTVAKTNDYGSDLGFSAVAAQNVPSFANSNNNGPQSYGSYSAPAQNVPSFTNSDNSGQQSSSYNAGGSSYGSPSVNPSGSYGSYSAPAQNVPSFTNSDNSGQQSSSYNAGGSSYGSPSINPSGSYGSFSAPVQNVPAFANSDNSGQQSSSYNAGSSYGSPSVNPDGSYGSYSAPAQNVPSYSNSNSYGEQVLSDSIGDGSLYPNNCPQSASNPCTPDGKQYYPLPGAPSCYIQCAFDIMIIKNCPANLVWNTILDVCDWPDFRYTTSKEEYNNNGYDGATNSYTSQSTGVVPTSQQNSGYNQPSTSYSSSYATGPVNSGDYGLKSMLNNIGNQRNAQFVQSSLPTNAVGPWRRKKRQLLNRKKRQFVGPYGGGPFPFPPLPVGFEVPIGLPVAPIAFPGPIGFPGVLNGFGGPGFGGPGFGDVIPSIPGPFPIPPPGPFPFPVPVPIPAPIPLPPPPIPVPIPAPIPIPPPIGPISPLLPPLPVNIPATLVPGPLFPFAGLGGPFPGGVASPFAGFPGGYGGPYGGSFPGGFPGGFETFPGSYPFPGGFGGGYPGPFIEPYPYPTSFPSIEPSGPYGMHHRKHHKHSDYDGDYDKGYKKDYDRGYGKDYDRGYNKGYKDGHDKDYDRSKNYKKSYSDNDDSSYNDYHRRKRQYSTTPLIKDNNLEGRLPAYATKEEKIEITIPIDGSPCIGKGNKGNVAHPTDRTKYISCLTDVKYEIMECPKGLIYNRVSDQCEKMNGEALCESKPCMNDGQCYATSTTEYKCTCREMFTGDRCETPLSSCVNEPCGKGVECVTLKADDYPQDYACVCDERKSYGLTCDKNTVPNPCMTVDGNQQYYPFAFSSRAYVQCNGEKINLLPCPSGLYWNQEKKTCDHAETSPAKPASDQPTYISSDSISVVNYIQKPSTQRQLLSSSNEDIIFRPRQQLNNRRLQTIQQYSSDQQLFNKPVRLNSYSTRQQSDQYSGMLPQRQQQPINSYGGYMQNDQQRLQTSLRDIIQPSSESLSLEAKSQLFADNNDLLQEQPQLNAYGQILNGDVSSKIGSRSMQQRQMNSYGSNQQRQLSNDLPQTSLTLNQYSSQPSSYGQQKQFGDISQSFISPNQRTQTFRSMNSNQPSFADKTSSFFSQRQQPVNYGSGSSDLSGNVQNDIGSPRRVINGLLNSQYQQPQQQNAYKKKRRRRQLPYQTSQLMYSKSALDNPLSYLSSSFKHSPMALTRTQQTWIPQNYQTVAYSNAYQPTFVQTTLDQQIPLSFSDQLCQGRAPGSVITHPSTTKKFIVCVDTAKGVEQDCPSGLHYNTIAARCERKANQNEPPCSSNPCLNGGQCSEDGPVAYKCNCVEGFSGVQCEIDSRACDQQPCGPQGLCQGFRYGAALPYICICPRFSYGPNCQQTFPNPCTEDGTHPLGFTDKGFIMCDGTQYYIQSCPSELVWDSSVQTCIRPGTQFPDQSQGVSYKGDVQRPLSDVVQQQGYSSQQYSKPRPLSDVVQQQGYS
ncbi:unnamed protein product, partial [Didymodactylos carnosus]